MRIAIGLLLFCMMTNWELRSGKSHRTIPINQNIVQLGFQPADANRLIHDNLSQNGFQTTNFSNKILEIDTILGFESFAGSYGTKITRDEPNALDMTVRLGKYTGHAYISARDIADMPESPGNYKTRLYSRALRSCLRNLEQQLECTLP